MRPLTNKRAARNSESGYALLMMMFFLALLVLSTVVAAPTVLSSIQREREAEMVWRGRQYVRGIRLYYLKMHHFPTSLDDLTKPKTGVRFMRQAYKDPMNGADGSWRLIYVGPSGQLIGSLNNRAITMNGSFGAQPAPGTQSSNGASSFGNSSFGSSNSLNSSASSLNQTSGNAQGSAVGTALQDSSSSTDPNSQDPDAASNDPSQPHSIGTMDASNTIGGNIIGVGSKVNRKSFLWYEKAKNYRKFEFIWDPSKDLSIGRASMGIGTPAQNMNGNSGAPGTVNQSPSPGSNAGGNQDPNQMPPLQAPPPNQ
jgi:type II secretory pathway pseudopilin PulG